MQNYVLIRIFRGAFDAGYCKFFRYNLFRLIRRRHFGVFKERLVNSINVKSYLAVPLWLT